MEKESIKLAGIFNHSMVLQRDAQIPVWGTAPSGCEVIVEFCGHTYETKAVNGAWRVYLMPLKAGGPFTMKILCGDTQIVLHDILVGEVWLAGGQSNMQFSLQNGLNAKEEISAANYNEIRYYDVPRIEYESVDKTIGDIQDNGWWICSPENAGGFSAVAYHFAQNLYKSLNVPIGIIGCNWGGTSASCWMSGEYLSGDNQINVYLEEYYDAIKNLTDDDYISQYKNYNRSVEEYNTKLEQFKELIPNADYKLTVENIGSYPWPPPMGRMSFMRPAGLYHTMLKKVVTYGIRGVIFYQGESDTSKPHLYKKLFERMIQNWREDWNNQSLPFLFVQIAYFDDENAEKDSWAILREAQLHTMQCDKNTAMAVITDCGEKENIHPVNKKPVGERLALLALSKVYGQEIECFGPIYRSYEISGDQMIIHFDHADNGLTAKDGNLKGFMICGEEKVFVNADARIKGDKIVVWSEQIKNPVAVRYGWANYSEVNLYNREGLPASPFKTDSFLSK